MESSTVNFYGREFFANKNVLTPRPETESLVDEALILNGIAYLLGIKAPKAKLPENPVILDIGTGSGCIGITIKLEIPNARLTCIDISALALKVARKNAKKLNADVEFLESDLLENYAGESPDLIIANLPYVDENWDWLDKKALQSDPSIALYAEDGGLAIIKRLLMEIVDRDWHPQLISEADPSQHAKIIEFAEKMGYHLEKSENFLLSFTR